MKFIVVGVGPGDPDLVTAGALKAIRSAGLVLSPHSRLERASVAETAVRTHIPDLEVSPVLFPMTNDAQKRDAELLSQLEALRPKWEGAETIVLPVIGDSTLYATGFYLFELWKKLVPKLELELLPGISAHCLAAAKSGNFLAMGTDILTIIPATAEPEKITAALKATDAAAMYKPVALRDRLRAVVESAGPWQRILRIDRAGLPNQAVFEGDAALDPSEEYLSILLLWRHA
ncbi:MAG: precorrin-2 C(20)-methyltransferase [Pyramidobacter sp.]|nr:precorrin-2 C(20)-methyltransferase [Pyramidobacter sp.]